MFSRESQLKLELYFLQIIEKKDNKYVTSIAETVFFKSYQK